jgi:hypothetical protein
MNASMQIHKLGFQVLPILTPRRAIHSWSRISLELEIRRSQQIDRYSLRLSVLCCPYSEPGPSNGTLVSVELPGGPKSLRLNITDNGVSLVPDTAEPKPGLGLISMRERLQIRLLILC